MLKKLLNKLKDRWFYKELDISSERIVQVFDYNGILIETICYDNLKEFLPDKIDSYIIDNAYLPKEKHYRFNIRQATKIEQVLYSRTSQLRTKG